MWESLSLHPSVRPICLEMLVYNALSPPFPIPQKTQSQNTDSHRHTDTDTIEHINNHLTSAYIHISRLYRPIRLWCQSICRKRAHDFGYGICANPRMTNKATKKKSGASRQCQPLLICLEFFIYVVKLFNTLLSLARICVMKIAFPPYRYSDHNTGYCYVLLSLTAVAASAIITYT